MTAQQIGKPPRSIGDLTPGKAPIPIDQGLALGHRVSDGVVDPTEVQGSIEHSEHSTAASLQWKPDFRPQEHGLVGR
jgi:hypothetical protein